MDIEMDETPGPIIESEMRLATGEVEGPLDPHGNEPELAKDTFELSP
jgi:hypothetical protein